MAKLTKSYKEHLYERLKDPAQAAGYLNTILEEEDVEVFLLALRHVADARGITKVAAAAGLNRENIYRILSDQGNPRLSSMVALLQAVGIQLQVKPLRKEVASARVSVRPSLIHAVKDLKPEEPQGVSCSLDEEHEREYGSAHTRNNEPVAA